VLVAVRPQVPEEPFGRGVVLVAPPGQGEDMLRRWFDGYDGDADGGHGPGRGQPIRPGPWWHPPRATDP
jgi:hypothetical protein